jgi:S1-C subfamily serine protease
VSELFLHWQDPGTRARRSRIVTNGLRIGSSEGLADVRIPAAGVNAVHIELRVLADGSCEVACMGSSRIVANGETTSRCAVVAGTIIQLGSLTLRFEATASLVPSEGPVSRPSATRAPSTSRPSAHASVPRGTRIAIGAASAAALLVAAGAAFLVTRRPEAKPVLVATVRVTPVARENPAPKATPVPASGVPTAAAEKDLFSQARKSVVTVIAKHSFEKGFSTGTGFFVDAQGRVVTNYHVVKQSDYQQILLPGSKQPVDARILSQDKEGDLVLLQAYVTPPVPVAPMIPVSTELKMGDTVYALGSPAGPELAVSLSRGIVSTDRPRTFGDQTFIQHDAAVNPGNSGGPLLNGRGEVVGMNTAKIKGTEGISFAIPIEDVRRFVEIAR